MKNLPKVIVVDANFIVAYCSSNTPSDDRARIADFIERAEKAKSKVVFPMVAVAEFLVGAELAGIEFLNTLEKNSCIHMADFNKAAAYELAQIDRAVIGAGGHGVGQAVCALARRAGKGARTGAARP